MRNITRGRDSAWCLSSTCVLMEVEFMAATQPGLISAAQSVDVSPASVSLLLTLVSCSNLGWLAVFFWKHNTDFRQMIEE